MEKHSPKTSVFHYRFLKETVEIGIILAFPTDGSGRAMTRVDHGIVGQGHEFFLDFAEELRQRSTGKIGASDGLREECIAAEYDAVSSQANAAGGVAGRMKYP